MTGRPRNHRRTSVRSVHFGAPAALVLVGSLSCSDVDRGAPQRDVRTGIHLSDQTEAMGLDWSHRNGATEQRFLPETMGAGVAIFDVDQDGALDLFFVGGLAVAELTVETPEPTGATGGNAGLWLGDGAGSFREASDASGLASPQLGMGVAVGDIDNDGRDDLVVTGVGGDRLFLNRSAPGHPRFVDATRTHGLDNTLKGGTETSFSSSAALLDFDRDGWLDLFIARYVTWSPDSDRPCRPDGVHHSYCTPEAYPEIASRLYRNLGDGRFENVTSQAGIDRPGKAMGVAVLDLDDDLWPDLVVANDTTRNFLFRNRGDGSFAEVGLEFGIALGQSGAPRGAMGIDTGDLDGDLAPEIVVGNFAQETSAIYRRSESGLYVDQAARWGVGLPTLMPLAFGVEMVDLDLDGWLDLAFVHGHIEPEIERFQPLQSHAQPPLVFRNLGGSGFQLAEAVGALDRKLVGRGLAHGDLDGDGDLDLVVTQNGGRARILRNDSPIDQRHFLRLTLEGTGTSNRSAYGARVDVAYPGGLQRRTLHSGSSYLSASEPVLTFGLGDVDQVDDVTVRWPSGLVQRVGPLDVDQLHHLVEPSTQNLPPATGESLPDQGEGSPSRR